MTDSLPLVSVLIANYNNGAFLKEAVNSVLNQTYTNWEIIIVDDASTDKSNSIIKRMQRADNRIKGFFNSTNMKVGATKSKATNLANGAICAILDPDDSLEPTALERHVLCHRKHPHSSVVGSNYYTCDENLKIIEKNKGLYRPKHYTSYLASQGGLHHFWSFKKEQYDKTSGFDAFFILAEDQDLFYKMEEVGKIEVLDEPLYYYRTHGNAISQGDKVSLAYAYHIFAQLDALNRRTAKTSEASRVKRAILEFMDWGFPKIEKDFRIKLLAGILKRFPQLVCKRSVLSGLYGLAK